MLLSARSVFVLTFLSCAWFMGESLAQAPGEQNSAGERLVTPEELLQGEVPPVVTLQEGEAPVVWNPQEVDDFQLVDQLGRPVTREFLRGKPWVVNFIFTRCVTACPATCRKMMELIESVNEVDMRFVTITVDPENDSVEQMAKFAEIWQADPEKWLFCTGEKEALYKLIRTGFKVSAWENFGDKRLPGYEFAHDNHLLHIDPQGKILGRYNSMVDTELALLGRVLRGEIETPVKHRPAALENAASPAKIVGGSTGAGGDAGEDPLAKLPPWAQRLPATNAMLNGLSTLLLLTGFLAIKAKREHLHKQMMVTAFGVSILFLGCYLTYHWALHEYTGTHGKPFTGTGGIRTLYFSILISHVVLAATVPVLAVVTLVKGYAQNWESHRRWAKVTFPIWLYVSITGVIIYWMLYRMG
jgi:protein SCO1/2/putative membrane protein